MAVIDPTNCASLAHTDSVGNVICMWHIRRSFARGWGNLFTFGRGLDRINVPCMWCIITVLFCLMANAPYFPGVGGGGGFTLTGVIFWRFGSQFFAFRNSAKAGYIHSFSHTFS